MSQSQPMCSFRFKHDPHLRCPHPVEKNGKCIFHLGEPLEKFQEELRSYLERLKNDSAEIWDFRGFIFPEPVNWSGETFPKKIDFRGAVFKAEAKFTEAIFKADAFFRVSNFKAVADFEDSIFEAAHFLGSTFKADADFGGSIFKADIHFEGSTFEGRAIFLGPDERRCFFGESRFDVLSLGKESQVEFDKVDLGRATFLDTDLERIVFRDVDWAQPKSRLFLRRKLALWDEVRPTEEHEKDLDYEKIAENYRQLVLNYERKRDYEAAEQFHIGEMEMRRKKRGMGIAPGWQRKLSEWLNTYALYRLLSTRRKY